MSLIVEDGTGLENANSFIDVEEARALATVRGLSLNPDDTKLSAILVNSADRIVSYESQFSGKRTNPEQGLSYPRKGSFRYGSLIASNSIPRELKLAQVVMADMIEQGIEIWAVDVAGIKEETVGPIKTVYGDNKADSVGNPDLPQVDSILKPLFGVIMSNFMVGR